MSEPMPEPKKATSAKGEPMHYSVGAIIKSEDKYFLMDRAIEPFGFASPAGHIDEGETPEKAMIREVFEEVGLKVTSSKLIAEEELDWNYCSKNVNTHYWYVYECEAEGNPTRNEREAKSIGWYTKEEIKNLLLEPVWAYWFYKFKII